MTVRRMGEHEENGSRIESMRRTSANTARPGITLMAESTNTVDRVGLMAGMSTLISPMPT